MSASAWIFVLTVPAVCAVASGVLSPPTNVRLTSHNFDLVLRWDPPAGAASSGLVYTAEYRSSAIRHYRPGCASTSTLQCDFTSHNISVYGTYKGRVRALQGAETSPWVESTNLTLDKNTLIGAPSVLLFSNGATLEVSIKDPVFMISTLRAVYHQITYKVTYWKHGQKETANSLSNQDLNRVVLSSLESLTKYCVQVQIHTDWNPNPSEPSSVVCESTTKEDESLWVAVVVAVVVMAVAVVLVVVAVVKWKSIRQFLCPKDSLPRPLEKSLLRHPNSTMYLNLQPVEEICDPVSIIAGDWATEEGSPPEAEQCDDTAAER